VSFCCLIKGISLKTCILCLCSFEPFCVWITTKLFRFYRTSISFPLSQVRSKLTIQNWCGMSYKKIKGMPPTHTHTKKERKKERKKESTVYKNITNTPLCPNLSHQSGTEQCWTKKKVSERDSNGWGNKRVREKQVGTWQLYFPRTVV